MTRTVIFLSFCLIFTQCQQLPHALGVPTARRTCSKYIAYENDQAKPDDNQKIGFRTDSLIVDGDAYYSLSIFQEKCFPKESIYFMRNVKDVIMLAVNHGASDTVKAQVLFDFNASTNQIWRVRHFGFGNVLGISKEGVIRNPVDQNDDVYVFNCAHNSYYFGQELSLSDQVLRLQRVYVSKKYGIVKMSYIKVGATLTKVDVIHPRWQKVRHELESN